MRGFYCHSLSGGIPRNCDGMVAAIRTRRQALYQQRLSKVGRPRRVGCSSGRTGLLDGRAGPGGVPRADPRVPRAARGAEPLLALLLLVCVATRCGTRGQSAIADWDKHHAHPLWSGWAAPATARRVGAAPRPLAAAPVDRAPAARRPRRRLRRGARHRLRRPRAPGHGRLPQRRHRPHPRPRLSQDPGLPPDRE